MSRVITGILFGMAEDEKLFSAYHPAQYQVTRANREFSIVTGPKYLVHAFSRWGKSAAATSATIMIDRFAVKRVIHIGLAGSVNGAVKSGDVVLVNRAYYRDLNMKGVLGLDKGEIPILNRSFFPSDKALFAMAQIVIKRTVEEFTVWGKEFDPVLHVGAIATGDTFVEEKEELALQKENPRLYCADMETAAIAQVCYEFQVPFLAVKIISEKKTTLKSFAFNDFVENFSSVISAKIAEQLVDKL